MTGNVTVGLNGSPESFAAVEWAAREAVLRELPLHIVHVQEWPPTPETPVPSHLSQEDERLLQEASRVAGNSCPSLTIKTKHLVAYHPAEALLTEVNTPGEVDLLVLGARGLDRFARFITGSTSLPVVAASARPVVLVRGTAKDSPGSDTGELVLGVDLAGDEASEELLAFAFAEAARRHSRLRVLHAWSLPPMYSFAQTADPGIGQELAGHISQNLTNTVAPWQERFPAVRVESKAVMGAPGAELIYASTGADLLVIGRRRRSVPVGPRLGHVAHAAIHHATCPVAVIPHG
jgi:nucleotide-binding universal stress UspA family protein